MKVLIACLLCLSVSNCGSSGVSRKWIYNVNLCPSSDIEQSISVWSELEVDLCVCIHVSSTRRNLVILEWGSWCTCLHRIFRHRAECGHFGVSRKSMFVCLHQNVVIFGVNGKLMRVLTSDFQVSRGTLPRSPLVWRLMWAAQRALTAASRPRPLQPSCGRKTMPSWLSMTTGMWQQEQQQQQTNKQKTPGTANTDP